MEHLGGPDKTHTVLDSARKQVAAAGLGQLHFAAFASSTEGVPQLREAGFDSTTCYYITASGKAALPDRPLDDYADLMACHEAFWKEMDTGVLPHAPTVTVGWDPSPRWVQDTPWPPPGDRGYPYGTLVVNNTPQRFGLLVQRASNTPNPPQMRPPAIVINAWNEWTEGSVLLPDIKYQTRFLEEVDGAGRNEETSRRGPCPPRGGSSGQARRRWSGGRRGRRSSPSPPCRWRSGSAAPCDRR